MAANPLRELQKHGQSVWLDDLSRDMLDDGTLERLIREDGISGITSNPKIFKEAITSGGAYDEEIRALSERDLTDREIFEGLAISDVRRACDLLRSVHQETAGEDGFVSLEVSPRLARDTEGTIEEAARLWSQVDRPNLYIKIPGTIEGLPAIRASLESGININITLLFSLERYREVLDAWQGAMDARLDRSEGVDVHSVASFFLSRIDSKIDPLLDEIGGEAEQARGRAAVASAKLAAAIWRDHFNESNGAWKRANRAGAAPQRLLWASTSTKDPAYPDTKYVEELIGPQTITTLPRKTLDAFREHGKVAPTLDRATDEQGVLMKKLAEWGIDMGRITGELIDEGIEKFIQPFDELLGSVGEKRQTLAGRR